MEFYLSGKRPAELTPLNITGFTLPDAAKALGVSHRTVRRAIADGRVEAVPIPPHYKLIAPEEIERVRAEGLRRGWGGPRRREGAPP